MGISRLEEYDFSESMWLILTQHKRLSKDTGKVVDQTMIYKPCGTGDKTDSSKEEQRSSAHWLMGH